MPRKLILLGAITALSFPVAVAQASSGRDSDHDGMPNRYEQRYGLSVRTDDAAKDKDHDGVSNLDEYHAGTNPRRRDTDRNGVRDGLEASGKVASFDGTMLTITRADGSTLAGTVTASTELTCGVVATPAAVRASHGSDDHGSDDHSGRGRGGDDSQDDRSGSGSGRDHAEDDTPTPSPAPTPAPLPGTTPTPTPAPAGDDHGNHSGDDDHHSGGTSCTTAALVTGAAVWNAEVSGTTFREVKLA